MILTASQRPGAGRVTLDQLVQHHAQRQGEALALMDAPDRPLWTEGRPRRLTWAQVEAATAAVAGRLTELGLATDNVVAIQGPNASDTLIAILGCLRAQLVPAPMPANWRNAEAAEAIVRIGAKAIFAATRAGPAHPADALRYVAAETFAIRFVCGFGAETPDGVVPFEDCIATPRPPAASARGTRMGNPAEHLAAVTWDCGSHGPFPVARNHNEWLAAGLAVLSGLGLDRESVLLSTLSPCGFAGLATGLVPWLMSGCALVLHQAFDATVFGVQVERHAVTHAVLPEVVATAGRREGLLQGPSLRGIASVTRRADLPMGPSIEDGPRTSAFAVLGELGLTAVTPGADGTPTLPLASPAQAEGVDAAGITFEVDPGGMLRLRGAMVPRAAFPGSERGAAYPLATDGWVSTGFPATADGGHARIEGPRRDVLTIGGHTLSLAALDSLYSDVPGAMAVNAVARPDTLLGQRLVLEAMPEAGSELTTVSLAMHAETKSASPLAMTADAFIGDRRKSARLAGAA
ncbi:AMP-binding protein [Labrys wisconsinensis]|uniref:Acyl-CoA synthetase (AMP-forming)/AMP-acid ligase II n=1 Tax=Labrys wisconsinensis TaxID=425677 RepID=A0ABU0J3G6_9HYPH|nr:class I adenylate-forming enzyme family protein [Labrys wisconsinensis]MDQ0468805.1 acyl-CoA synthetase (AMP-forming)/AMP-acid ligase II [Labrys wisconsinensis]